MFLCEKCAHNKICCLKENYERKVLKIDAILNENPKTGAFSFDLKCVEYLQETNGLNIR